MSETSGFSYPSITSDGFMQTISQPRPGVEKYVFSHNFCNATSWFDNADAVSNFEMTNSGDLTTWNTGSTHVNWIDLKHGHLFDEENILAAQPELAAVIEVSNDDGETWVEKTENTWRKVDGDFSINYTDGTITFNSALSFGARVRASFYKARETYSWIIAPAAGKKLKVLYVELQFTSDLDFNNIVEYEIWGYNPYDLPNKMMYASRIYKRIQDFFLESTGPYPVMPAFGGESAGLSSGLITLPFKYLAYRELKSSEGAEVRVKLRDPGALGGEFAAITFYCLTEAEV